MLPSLLVAACFGLLAVGVALLGSASSVRRPERPKRRRYQWPAIAVPSGLCVFALLKAQAIREKIGELMDRVQAIADLADGRDLTAEEKGEVDSILGSGKKGAPDYKPGQIDALERDLERAEKLEARAAELAQGRRVPTQRSDGPGTSPDPDDDTPRVARVRIPIAAQYRYGRLKAFTGPHAERSAYLAGQFFLATLFRNSRAAQWCQQFGVATSFQAALSEGADSSGGFLVPGEVEQAIIDLRETYGVFRRRAQIVPMGRDTKTQPIRNSGVTAAWVGENDEITASDKAWRQLNLVARKLAALTRYSTELGEDATISIGDDLTKEFAYAFAVAEDQAGFIGDGTSTYGHQTGIRNALAAGSIHTAVAGNTAFSTLDMDDFEAVCGKLPELPGIQPAWYISKPGYWNSMVRLMAAQGGTTWEKTATGQVVPMFLGYPVEYTHVLPTALTAQVSTQLCYFGDLAMGAMLGNRRGLTIQISDQRYFEFDQIGIKGCERVNVVVHSTGDASNPGCIVALKTPAN
jgi:HK97 family phage major capsid protein